MSVNIHHHAILQGTADRLEELIPLCRQRGPLSGCDPALMADVTRKAWFALSRMKVALMRRLP